MKKARFVFPALALLLLVAPACTKTDMNTISISEAESIIPGSYRVNLYDDGSGNNGTYDLYTFDFQSNGVLMAGNGLESFSGTWTIASVNEAEYEMEVDITMTGNPDLEALANNWFVEDVTDVTLYLTDASGAEVLHFIKN